MQTVKCEMIECRRFLAAWSRFQTDTKHHFEDYILSHYQQLALHYQELMQENAELKTLESDLSSVLSAINGLRKAKTSIATSQRIPRASELVKLRKKQLPPMTSRPNVEITGKIAEETQSVAGIKANENESPSMPVLCSDFTKEDFQSMLETVAPQEECLSAKAIRKRLGLVDRMEAQASTAVEKVAQEEQELLQAEMMSLAKQLKERTQTINQSLVEDVKILDAVGQSAESNTMLLDRENAKLKQQVASSIGLWTSLWLVAMLVIVFIVTYFYMKLFSRRW